MKYNNFLGVLVIFFSLFSCYKVQCQIVKNINNDTIIIKNKTAILYEPTDKSIENRKKESKEEDLYTVADDDIFYIYESEKYLKSKNINVISIKNNKVLKFVSSNKTITFINLSEENEIWGMYFFDSKKQVKKVDMTSIEEEYKRYFVK